MFDRSFDLTDEPSSVRAARALARLTGLAWSETRVADPVLAAAG
ncbi:hypothetical protein ACRAWD_27240 [Caulobacter segnis]